MATIPSEAIARYAAGPSAAKTSSVATLQETIRDVLGDDFDTFLQGSYRNDTALADINDVDIVARLKGERSPLSTTEWDSLFERVAGKLNRSWRINGTVSVGDKCVKLTTPSLKADVVPAVAVDTLTEDPVAIRSRRRRIEIENFPRTHYTNGVKKQRATGDSFKGTTRLFKRWTRQYFAGSKTAPSYYIECAVHTVGSSRFDSYLPRSFLQVGREIASWSRNKVINSVAGDKDILVSDEWSPNRFEEFKAPLSRDLNIVAGALRAPTTDEAVRKWKLAFGD